MDQNLHVGCPDIGIPVDLTRYYTRQLVSALEYLHTVMKVVHRDLKPENVLIDRHGFIKLTDFGTAKVRLAICLGAGGNHAPLSHACVVVPAQDTTVPDHSDDALVGTAEYLCPEALKEDKEVSFPADLWALGCTVYQMLVGRPPFRATFDSDDFHLAGVNDFQTFQAVLEFKSIDSLVFPDHIPPAAKEFVGALLRPNPKERLGAGPVGSDTGASCLCRPFAGGVSDH